VGLVEKFCDSIAPIRIINPLNHTFASRTVGSSRWRRRRIRSRSLRMSGTAALEIWNAVLAACLSAAPERSLQNVLIDPSRIRSEPCIAAWNTSLDTNRTATVFCQAERSSASFHRLLLLHRGSMVSLCMP
jgi:hypothetical protein